MPAFVAVLPISVRCEDQYRDQHGFPRPTALLALNMVDVLESQRLPTHELDPVFLSTPANQIAQFNSFPPKDKFTLGWRHKSLAEI